jgi:hypothetical protein
MMVNGKMTIGMAKAFAIFPMEINTMVNGKITR